MLRRKNYWLLFAILLLSLTSLSPSMQVNTSYGPREVNEPQHLSAPDKQKTGTVDSLRITVALHPEELTELKALSSSYTLSTGVNIELKNVDEDHADDYMMKELTVGESPDILLTNGRNILNLAKHGYLLPIDIYRSVPGSATLARLIPLMQWNGYDWGVPLDIDPYVLVYSPQRLAELGVQALPRSPGEWNTVLENHHKEEGKALFALNPHNPYGLAALLESMGESLTSDKTDTLKWIQQILGSIHLYDPNDMTLWDQIQDGRIAVAAVPYSQWKKDGNATLKAEAVLGTHGAKGILSISSRSFALPAQSAHPEEAVKWLAYVTGMSAQLDWLDATDRLPALDEIYRSALPFGLKLPFDPKQLLAEETAPLEEPEGGWKKLTESVMLFLTGKMNAETFGKQLQPSE